MLSSSNISVPDTLTLFKSAGINVTFLVPTETGLLKSIMDAHDSAREFFKEQGLHDYEAQGQGAGSKVTIETLLITSTGVLETTASLYRPESKSGDPRIWIYGLKKHAAAGDLLALAVHRKQLVVLNASESDLEKTLKYHPVLNQISALQESTIRPEATELLTMLKGVGREGWIQTLRKGDTGVGFTLEEKLGIAANSSKAPDYKGIELKSHRHRKGKGTQITAFSQVPDWKNSRLKGSKEILRERGKFSEERQRNQLFHEISSLKPNSYGLQLSLSDDGYLLHQLYVPDGAGAPVEKDVQWAMGTLQARMQEKHTETMWVTAETAGKGADEAFHYTEAIHTYGYDSSAFTLLLETGAMTVHYLIKEKPNGAVKDQGYLFKTAPKYISTLFASSHTHALA